MTGIYVNLTNVTPCVYANNNPIVNISPDGMEVVKAFDTRYGKKPNEDPQIIKAADKDIHKNNNSVISIYVHGWDGGFQHQRNYDQRDLDITTVDQFKNFLSEKSEVWQNRTDDSPITITLIACNTGDSDMAAEMSKEPNVTVIGADANVQVSAKNGFENLREKDSVSKKPSGSWRVFQNGEQVMTMGPTWKPTHVPPIDDSKWKIKPSYSKDL